MSQEELEILIEELRALPIETEWVEFKENNYNPQEIGEYISALSNSAGLLNKEFGYLVFGIEDETHLMKGTSFNPKNEKVGNQEIENWLNTQLDPKIDFIIHNFSYKDKDLVIIQIDSSENRPVRFRGEAYIRIGSYKKKLKDHPEKEQKIWQKLKKIVFEKELALQKLEADEVLKLLNYPSFFKLLNLPLPPNKDSILEKLTEEKVIKKHLNKFHITNLGAILFADKLHNFENLSRKTLRVIIYDGKNKLKTIKEYTGTKGYAVEFQEILDYINDKLPSNEEIDKALRKDIKTYPELAIRELTVNALIHQDFSISGTGPMVEIFSNRIEITNPGKPLIDTRRFIDHSPESRNEMLAKLMRRMGFCEERGSGIDKVIHEIETFRLPAPEFIDGDNFTRVIVHSPKSLRQISKPDKIRACYQHCSLQYVSGEYMTNESLRERFNIDKRNYPQASRIIKDTLEAELIKEYDNTRKYIPYWV